MKHGHGHERHKSRQMVHYDTRWLHYYYYLFASGHLGTKCYDNRKKEKQKDFFCIHEIQMSG